MNYPREITSVHQLEISSECNLRCKYCPHPHLERTKENMTIDTFHKAMEWIKQFEEQGTQNELALTGMGEAVLNPEFRYMAKECRAVLSGRITLSSNGVAFNENEAKVCADYGIELYISAHRPEKAGPAIQLGRKYGILKDVNGAPMVSAFDWGGQVDWYVSAPKIQCDYLKKGWCVILVNGDVTTCCIDAHGKGIIYNVEDNPTPSGTTMAPWALCDTCHMQVPQ